LTNNVVSLKGLNTIPYRFLSTGLVLDRVHDWADIIYDMRVDLAGPLPPNPKIPEADEFIVRTEKFYEDIKTKRRDKKKRAKDEL
jgi:hypothetical protein